MFINTDINILGGLPDLNLVNYFMFKDNREARNRDDHYSYTAIKTDKSVKRFEKAITGTLLQFNNKEVELLVKSLIVAESISPDSLLMLFWNASKNNDLLHFLNDQIYFPAFYSGRLGIKKEEVSACIKELKVAEQIMKVWTIGTIQTVAYKYLTLLKKFNLMEGGVNKRIIHPYLNDKMFVLFIYWLKAIEVKSNLMESEWVKYCFYEQSVFIERILQKKFSRFYYLNYTGDKLMIETSIPYESIYDAVK